MEITETKNIRAVVCKEDNFVVVTCGKTQITYPLDEMKLIFRTMR